MDRSEISSQHVAKLSATDLSGYWWYAVRLAQVRAALAAAEVTPMRYLDLGCGTGGVMSGIVAALAPERSLGLDGTQSAVEVAASRGLDARYADFRAPLELPFVPNAISCLDVLEHLEDPAALLRHAAECADPSATLIVTVPAMPSLRSAWDDACGHYRRYSRSLLREHLLAGGWRPVRTRHLFSWCVPPAWIQRRLLRRAQEIEFPPVTPLVNRIMIGLGGIERRLGSPAPFGTSLLAVACRA